MRRLGIRNNRENFTSGQGSKPVTKLSQPMQALANQSFAHKVFDEQA